MPHELIAHRLTADAYRIEAEKLIKDLYGVDGAAVGFLTDTIDAGRVLGMGPRACVRQIAQRIRWEEIP